MRCPSRSTAADPATAENIQVYARVRRCGDGEGSCLRVHADTGEITAWRARKAGEPALTEPLHSFCFDQVGDIDTAQTAVFEAVGRPIADTALAGFNATVFAFGQTGAGKTHTMFGEADEQRGLAPRMLECLFERMHDAQAEGRFRCRASHLEIYNETLTDLLCTAPGATRPPLRLREDTTHGVYVANVTLVELTSTDQALRALGGGLAARTVGSTAMNGKSSRSHAVFTLHIEQEHDATAVSTATRRPASGTATQVCRRSQLHLIDLAGSERFNDACTSSARRKEACNINKSLSALGNVMGALVSVTPGQPRHVPYRESKLTMLLRDSLGGNARTTIVANVSASADCLAETISTLKFAQRAKLVRNHATRHEILVTPPSPPPQPQQPSLAQPPAAVPPAPVPLPQQPPHTARRQATRALPSAGSKPARSRLQRATSAPAREEAAKETTAREEAAAQEAATQEDEVQPEDVAAEEEATASAETEEVATGAEPVTPSEASLQEAQHETRQLIEAMKMRVEVALNTPSAPTSPPPPPPHCPAEAWATPRATPRLTPSGSTMRRATTTRLATPSAPSSASLGGAPLTTVMRWRAEAAAAEAAARAAQAGEEGMLSAHAEALEQTAATHAAAAAETEAEVEAQAEAHAKTLARAAYAEAKLREAQAETEAAAASAEARAAETVAAAEARAAKAEARAAEADRMRLATEQEVARVTEDAAQKSDEQILAAEEAMAQVKAAWAEEAQEEAEAWEAGSVVERGGLRRKLCLVTQALADERRRGAELADRIEAAREEAEGAAAAAAEAAAALVARDASSAKAHGQAWEAVPAVAAAAVAEMAEALKTAQLVQLEGERQTAEASVAHAFVLRRQRLEQEEAHATVLGRADEARLAAVEAAQAEWQRAEVLQDELSEAKRAAAVEAEVLRAQLEAAAVEVAAAAVSGRGGDQEDAADAGARGELQASRDEVAKLRDEVAALGRAARLVERQSEDRAAAAAALASAGNAAVERLSEAEYVALSSAVTAAEGGGSRGASPQRPQGRANGSSPGGGSGGEARLPACQRIARLLEQLSRSTSIRGDVRDGVAIGVLLAFEASQADFEAALGSGSGNGTRVAAAAGPLTSTTALVAPRRPQCESVDGVLVEARPRPGALQPPQPSPAAPRTSTTPPKSRSRQGAAVIARICELGRSGATVETIDASLSREGYRTSTGTPWPSRNDGRVVVRTLLRHGLQPVSHDPKVASYATDWATKMLGGPTALPQEQMPPNAAQQQQQQPGSPSTGGTDPSLWALHLSVGPRPGPDSPARRALGERPSSQ